jgi:hypothetical protein
MPRKPAPAPTTFTFHPRWREELVCTAAGGRFVLEFTMGAAGAYLPTQAAWPHKGPEWARELWPVLHDELQAWCRQHQAKFVVDAGASVWPDPQ